MTANAPSPLAPRLRFPEFRSEPEWEEAPLGRIADIKLGKMLSGEKHTTGRLLPYLNNIAVRWNEVDTSNLPQMYFGDDELERFGLKAGDVVVCEGGEPGRSAVWDGRLPDLKFQKAIHRVRFNVPFVPHLLVSYLEAIAGTDRFEALFTGGGIKHLTRETFAGLAIPLIPFAEQKKIAKCLTSLGDLIAAEGRKLEALRRHKEGLMQQLFPQPSESVPRLRFPEFEDAPDWNVTCLSEAFGTITNGRANAQDHQEDGEYPLFDRSEVVKRSPTFLFDAEAVIIPGEGMSFQPRHFKGKFNLHQRAYALMEPTVVPLFAFYAIDRFKDALADSAVHSTVRSLRMPIIEQFAIPCPQSDREQRAIADCLASLDSMIATQAETLNAVRTHKRGLLQQLFPDSEAR